MTSRMNYPLRYLEYDFVAGVVVFLVAIPLCLGIALASGAPLFSGIVAGILGGIVVGSLSASHISVSGPAAGMVAVVLAGITQLGSFEGFLLALFLAGILQIIIGVLRAGFIADYIPSNVIQGLLCAIGILIIIKQIPFTITYTSENALLLESLRRASDGIGADFLQDVISYHLNVGAILISIVTLGLLIYFDKTKHPKLKTIPGPIAVVIISIILNSFFEFFAPDFAQYSSELVNIPVHNGFSDFFKQFHHPDWSAWHNPKIYLYAFIFAAVASLEALLNLEGIEKLDVNRRYVSRNRELFAQGIANTCSGLIGGLPITSVIVRSSVNIQAGAKSKLSAIIHGILILLVAFFVPHWVNLIPLAALGTILIYVGYKLTKPYIYKEMYSQGFSRFIPFIITVIAIVSTNLLTGILIGLFFSFFFILRDNSQIQLDIINEKHPFGTVKRIILPQHVSFLRKASLVNELNQIAHNSHLIIDARNTKYIDRDILEVLEIFKQTQAPNNGIALNMIGFQDHYEIHNHIDFLNVTTYDTQANLTPDNVIEILKEGNKRFVSDKRINRSLLDEIKATANMQHPIAIVLSCIDSRVPVETVFDMGVGDVLVVRVAGNVINDDILGSMEFACQTAGAKLILVLGHTYCGAIKAACSGGADGHLTALLQKIKPAVIEAEKHKSQDDEDFMFEVTEINIKNSLNAIKKQSPTLNKMLSEKNIGLCGALYDIQTGAVTFL